MDLIEYLPSVYSTMTDEDNFPSDEMGDLTCQFDEQIQFFLVLPASQKITSRILLMRKKGMNPVRHVTGNDQDYLRKIPRAVVQISALL